MEIFINNSLSKNKDVLEIQEKPLTWYMCGPTVYNDSHLGHARTYLTFDIIRRILSDYFGQELFVVMNITDIDDKIIKRTIQEHLYNKFILMDEKQKESVYEKSVNEIQEMLKELKKDKEKNKDQIKKQVEKLKNYKSKEVMYEYLYNNADLNSIDLENEDFISFARKHEESFFKDMDALNIKRPDVVTRVTEYVPEIVKFIENIVQKKYAYEMDGSVYFDTRSFKFDHPKYYNPFNVNMTDDDDYVRKSEKFSKKDRADFALWKKAKPGEPWWDSPWSKGRPGWHIECSVMANSVLGDNMDIHSGGIDLLFPHHNNEILQCNAHHLPPYPDKYKSGLYYGAKDDFESPPSPEISYFWTKYFLHSGHLNIDGLKMSKSLKNFITIKESLQMNTSRQIRIMYLFHDWDKSMDYSNSSLEHAKVFEKTCTEFFPFLNYKIKKAEEFRKWTIDDEEFKQKIDKIKSEIHKNLSDNFGTKDSIILLQKLVTDTYLYVEKVGKVQKSLLSKTMDFFSKMMMVFGLTEKGTTGFSDKEQMNLEKTVTPYVDSLVEFRDKIRQQVFTIPNKKKLGKIEDVEELKKMIFDIKNGILSESDIIRDNKLLELGVQIEDKGKDKNSIWKFYDNSFKTNELNS